MNSIFRSKTKVLICFLLPLFLLFHRCSYFGQDGFDLQNESLELDNGVTVDMGTTKELIKPMYYLGIHGLETKRVSERSFNIKIKATDVALNNKRVFLDGESLRFEKDAQKNIYSLIDSQRKSKLDVDLDLRTFSFSYSDKLFNHENLEVLNPAQKIEFIKLLIVFQQFVREGSEQIATYKEWNERERASTRRKMALKSANHLGTMAGDCYRYNISLGVTRAAAAAEAQQDAEDFLQAYPTCSQLGEIDVTCLAALSPCIATVTFTCTGEICGRGFVTE